MPTVLVTGGAGYVGSHACKAFAAAGWTVVVFDNLSRGWRDMVKWGPLVEGDIRDTIALEVALRTYRPNLVAHFAAVAYVGESVGDPALYYDNNSVGTLSLLNAMRGASVPAILFSSTCASYGVPISDLIDEDHPQHPISPYGWSKFIVERMIEDHVSAYGLRAVILRYFNAAGADRDGEIGERHEPETHAIPLAIEAAYAGTAFGIFGTDFDTPDGTAIRDYIHVGDLADAHVRAAELLRTRDGSHSFNLGTETGTSVLHMIRAVERLTGRPLQTIAMPRRAGDPAKLVASAAKARRDLGWRPQSSDIDTIIDTALFWRNQAGASDLRQPRQ